MNKYLRIGVVTKPHGLRGEVKVYPTTDSLYRFDDVSRVILNPEGTGEKELKVEGAKYFKSQAILKFEGINTVEEAGLLRGAELYIPREEGVALEEGEYYIADIIGMDVIDEAGCLLGTVREVLETGANDVYIVKRADNGKDLMVPVIKDCIIDTDLEGNTITVRLMDGLLDL